MHLDLRVRLALLLLLSACGSEPESVSHKARVQARSGAVWARDLGAGLGLSEYELCAELGSYDCVSEAHLDTLGGVEPTTLGIDDPLPNAAVSAPIAVDRVASSACTIRYDLDQAGPAAIFGPVLDRDKARHRKQVSETLVRRLLGREPLKAEVDALTDLYDPIAEVSKDPQRDWSIGACVVVATSTEALFY